MSTASHRRRDAALALALLLVTAAVYAGVRHHDFVNYDDPAYVTENEQVRRGLTWGGLRWALGATDAANWHPLTWLSHMVDVELFGLDPGPHHLVNLLFHLLNALLVFELLRRMTGAAWRSWFVAALFALHPLHVESVAWIAERKDVLSSFFGLLALLAYAHYVARPEPVRYAGVLLSFTLGLAAKPMLVTLPCLLLLLDVWPLGRWGERRAFLQLLLEKLPFLALALASGAITLFAQQAGGALVGLHAVPLPARAAHAAVAYVKYLWRTVWPSGLAVPYPYPTALPVWKVSGAVLLLLAISWLAVAQRRRRPYVLVGWSWYLVTLFPVIGIVQAGDQALADRYSYLPLLGIFITIAWGVPDLLGAWRPRRPALAAAATIVLVALAVRTSRQVPVWHDTISLFRNALRVTAGNYVAHTYLGAALKDAGDLDEALLELEAVQAMGVAFPDAPYTLGLIHEARGDGERAADSYRQALRIKPDHMGALLQLGTWLESHGRSEEARSHYRNALPWLPGHPPQYNNLGVLLTRLGRPHEALSPLERAVALEPEDVEAKNNLGVAHLDLGHVEEAATYFTTALALEPRHRLARYNLGVAFQSAGRLAEALSHFERALELDPRSAETFAALGDTRARMGEPELAREAFERALELNPEAPGVRDKLAIVIRHLERAVQR